MFYFCDINSIKQSKQDHYRTIVLLPTFIGMKNIRYVTFHKNNARDSTQTTRMQAYSFAGYLNSIILFMQTISDEKNIHRMIVPITVQKVLDCKMHCQWLFSVSFAIQISSILQPTCTQIMLPKIYIVYFQQTEIEVILCNILVTYLGSLNNLEVSKPIKM